MEMNRNSNVADFIGLMDSFPCMFNLPSIKKPSHSRLRCLLQNMQQEVAQDHEDLEGEKVKILNIMCWIYFLFGMMNKAKEKNDEALEICPQSLISLGNQIYLKWYSNVDLSTNQQRLEKLKTKREFENEKLHAKAGQGYFLLRLGGEYNLSSSIQLLTEVTQRQPENYIWKYFLGLASRRTNTIHRHQTVGKKLSEDIFIDITKNSNNVYLKCLASSELAARMAINDELTSKVNKQIKAATRIFSNSENTSLNGENARIFRNCGTALKRKGNPSAIFHLEQAIAARPNSASHHVLAKCYADVKMTRDLDRSECDKKSILHFDKAFDVSLGSNVHSLFDKAFLFRTRNMFEECERQCWILSKCWRLEKVFNNPFNVAKIYENMIHSMRQNGGDLRGDFSDRYLSMALLTSLELFKRRPSQKAKYSTLDKIFNPSYKKLYGYKATFNLFYLLNCCRNPRSARRILLELIRHRRLGKKEIEEEIRKLLSEDRPDQALLIIDILDLDADNVPAIPETLKRRVTLEEAKWELGHGQIACKLLFHRMFNKSYSGQHTSSPDDDDQEEYGGADVVILYDAPQWKFFFLDDVEEPREDTESKQHYTMFEDILCHIFDLEVISNPWMSLSVDNRGVDNEFFTLVQHNNIKLVLLLTDEHTSDQFLQIADSLLGPILEGTTSEAGAAAMLTETTSDVAIISCDGRDCSDKLPSLRNARHFDARENGLRRRIEDLPSDVLAGTEIMDAFFSEKVENAMSFFNFIAPSKH